MDWTGWACSTIVANLQALLRCHGSEAIRVGCQVGTTGKGAAVVAGHDGGQPNWLS